MSTTRNIIEGIKNVTSDVSATLNTKANQSTTYTKTEVDDKPSGLKNYIINGGFDVWQRGTSFTNIYQYTADRWQVTRYGGTVNTVNIGTETTSSYGINNYMRIGYNSGGGGALYINQPIESINVKKLRGQYVTLSFYARGSVSQTLASAITYSTLAQGASSDQGMYYFGFKTTNGTENYGNHTISTDWQRFTRTVLIPNDMVQIGIAFGNQNYTDNRTFDIANIQLEQGSVATPFEQRPFGLELSLCQRYYEKSCDYSVVPAAGLGDRRLPSGASDVHYFNTVKRVSPTMSLYRALGSGNALDYYNAGWGQTTGISATTKSWIVDFSNNSYFIMSGIWTADAEL